MYLVLTGLSMRAVAQYTMSDAHSWREERNDSVLKANHYSMNVCARGGGGGERGVSQCMLVSGPDLRSL